MLPKILTFGYSGRSVDELAAVVEKERAVVFDIRLVPSGLEWSRESLAKRFAGRYQWVREFGNTALKPGEPAKFRNLDGGFKRLADYVVRGRTSVILLCSCEEPENCHRKAITDKLEADFSGNSPWPIVHLRKERPAIQESLWNSAAS